MSKFDGIRIKTPAPGDYQIPVDYGTDFDWQGRSSITVEAGKTYRSPWIDAPRTVTAPRNAEQALSLLSAGVGALASVELTEDERERVWRLIDKALYAVGEKR